MELFDKTIKLWRELDVTALTGMSILPMLIDFVATASKEKDRADLMARMSEAVILMGNISHKTSEQKNKLM